MAEDPCSALLKMLNKTLAPQNIWGNRLLLLGLFLLLGLVFQWVSLHFGYKRYLLNFETLLAFLIFSQGFRWLGLAGFIASIGQEIFLGMTSVFYLFDYAQIQTIAGFVFEAKLSYLIMLALLFGVVAVLFWGAVHSLRVVGWHRVFALLIVLILFQGALSFRDGNFLNPSLSERKNLLFGSSTYFIHELFDLNGKLFNLRSHENTDYIKIQQPSAAMVSLSEGNLSNKILFIIAESWGQSKNPLIIERQIQALRNSDKIQEIRLGTINAFGATAFGEFRELCGKLPTKLNLRKISQSTLGECLPAKLKRQGYKTVSVHGAHGTMYDRLIWYPVVGFENMVFKEVLPFSKKVQCYSFPGYCDRDLFDVVLNKLTSDEKVFLYWLTLNSHTPYDRRDIVNYQEDICKSLFDKAHSEQLCNYQNLHTQFFEQLATLLKNNNMSGVEVVVVGDHAPIFNDELSRELFEPKTVPMLHFRVK